MVDVTKFVSDESRRSVLKKGALTAAGAGVLGASADSAAAQEGTGTDDGGDDGDVLENYWKGLMQLGQAEPGRRFVITSPVIEWSPNVEEIQDNVWSDYNTRVARYLNGDEQVFLWVAHDAELPEYSEEQGYVVDAEGDTASDGTPQPEIYQFHTEWSPFGDANYVTVNFAPVGEDEEDEFLEDEDWWLGDDDEGTGTPDGTPVN